MPLPEKVRRYTFYILGGAICLAMTSLILYNNYILIEPHLHTLFWSLCTSILLTKVKQPIKAFLEGFANKINFKVRFVFHFFFWANYLYLLVYFLMRWYTYNISERFVFTISFIIVGVILLSPFILTTDTLSTIIAMILASFVLISITLLVARTGYMESMKASSVIKEFIEKNKEVFLESMNNYKENIMPLNVTDKIISIRSDNVTVWKTAERYCDFMLGVANSQYDFVKNVTNLIHTKNSTNDSIETLLGPKFCKSQIMYFQDNLYSFIQYVLNWMTSNISVFGYTLQSFFQTLVDLISNFKEFVFSSFIFVLFVFYFVQNDEFFIESMKKISPLTEEESTILIESIDTNIIKTLYYLCTFAICNFVVTTLSFYIVGFEIIFIFGFLSAFLSVIPIISNWIIWIPATIFVLSRDGLLSSNWIIIFASHISLYVIDNIIYTNFFKKQHPTMLGVSILLGVYVFNHSGIIKGPLFITLGMTFFDIATKYINKDKKEDGEAIQEGGMGLRHHRSKSFFDLIAEDWSSMKYDQDKKL